MSGKSEILDCIRKKRSERILFVPRLDIWYRARRYTDTLPDGCRHARLTDITDDLGTGFHAVVPDFMDFSEGESAIHAGLGLRQFRSCPYRLTLHNTGIRVEEDAGQIRVSYDTLYGTLTTRVIHDEGMRRSGFTLTHTAEHAVKSDADYKAAAHIFRNIEVTPKYEGLTAWQAEIGDRGPAAAFASLAGSPMHLLLRELFRMEDFYLAMADDPDGLGWLCSELGTFFERICAAAADSPADIVLLGANYDRMLTPPPFFREHILPTLQRQAGMIHARGKLMLTHTDGENRGLVEAYAESGADVADSVCPAPMTSLSLQETLDGLGGTAVIWGGIPSVCVVPECMEEKEFCSYIEKTIDIMDRGAPVILSIADTVPPNADFERVRYIAKKVEEKNASRWNKEQNDG